MSEYTDLRTLPVGTKFTVVNGDWSGQIILDDDFDKAVKIIPKKSFTTGFMTVLDKHELSVIERQEKTRNYKKITGDEDLILENIIIPEDYNVVPEPSKEYFEYLCSIAENMGDNYEN